MSKMIVKIKHIDAITPHNNADALEIAHLGAWTTCVKKGVFNVGDLVVFLPPDAILPKSLHQFLGITKYCSEMPKYSEDYKQGRCRVRAARLRGERSFGTLMTKNDLLKYVMTYTPEKCTSYGFMVDDDVADLLGITKYTPPEKIKSGDAAPENALFHQYTDIERYQNYPKAIDEGEHVVMLEKVHGTNSRIGLVMSNDDLVWMCGSHRSNRKQFDATGDLSLYWKPLTCNVVDMLTEIQNDTKAVSVVLFGEIYGRGIQDMQYDGNISFAAFDISVNGQYLDWPAVVKMCDKHSVSMVPVVYEGPFSEAILMEHTDGPTIVCEQPISKFKGREGVVVKPIVERQSQYLPNHGRVILKSVSVDYLNRRGGTDNA
jgi:RNA ligase (TIGR02306 family)